VRVALGTAEPDTRRETGHFEGLLSVRKILIFGMFRSISPYFAIPDNIALDSQV
jgi:hypothetical protein